MYTLLGESQRNLIPVRCRYCISVFFINMVKSTKSKSVAKGGHDGGTKTARGEPSFLHRAVPALA